MSQFNQNENWSFEMIKQLSKFLDLKPKQVYKWNYEQKLQYWRVRDKIRKNKHSGPLFSTVEK